jgi:hypothetical protein
MDNRRTFLKSVAASAALSSKSVQSPSTQNDRDYWISVLTKIADPVVSNLSQKQLKQRMPIETPTGYVKTHDYTHLEALGRLVAGIAPWLELQSGPAHERERREKYAELIRQSINAATDPRSPDFMNFTKGRQPAVDSAFLCQGILRAPNQLWRKLDTTTRRNLVNALKSTRIIRTSYNNHLLFSATIEAGLCFMEEDWDHMRVDYALRALQTWYKGDGAYGDGPDFHWDYYNSFVIHPMLLDVVNTTLNKDPKSDRTRIWDSFRPLILKRAVRYAEVQERLIAPDGSFPPIGRSLAYRFGAFHLLSQVALMKQLAEGVSPSQVRAALTAVIKRVINAPNTFDRDGWLRIGFYGSQPSIGESYISTGSLYLCSVVFLPLGLPAEDPFWSGREEDWTSKKIWSSQNIKPDHAMKEQ